MIVRITDFRISSVLFDRKWIHWRDDCASVEMIKSEDAEEMMKLYNDLWYAGKFDLSVTLLSALIVSTWKVDLTYVATTYYLSHTVLYWLVRT